MTAAIPKNFQGKLDEAVPRHGADTAAVILSSTLTMGRFASRVVMTESRRNLVGGSIPVCWAIITRLYELDADGWEVLDEIESLWINASVLERAYSDALDDSVKLIQGAILCEEVEK